MNEDCLTEELKYEAKAFNRIYQNKLLSQKEIDTMVSKILKMDVVIHVFILIL